MAIVDFKSKWAHGPPRGRPTYISSSKILIPSDFFMKTCDVSGKNLQYHFYPKIRIGCCSSLPELGIIAVSERKVNGNIYILNFPHMNNVSILEQTNNEVYSALQFMGLEFLLSLQIKNCYEIDIWKWLTGERINFLSVPLLDSELPSVNIIVNPLWWHQVLYQSNIRIILLEIKYSDERYFLSSTNYAFFEDEKGNIRLAIYEVNSAQKDFWEEVVNPSINFTTIQCVCWLPQNQMLVATAAGIFKVECETHTIDKIRDCKTGIASMIFSKCGLFIGYKTGFIDIIQLSGSRWHLLETINIKQPVNNMFMSPNFCILTVTSLKGSVIVNDISQGLSNFKTLMRPDIGGDIGVNYIGPLAQYCVTAKKNGLVHILRVFDGNIISSFQLDEEISSMATSPLCCCIVIGTNIGFVYFLDATNPRQPRIVYNSRPYEIAINHLKFDNFGLFLISSAQNQSVNIWNGLPSSGFLSLGFKKVASHVKDIAAFRKFLKDETLLLILTESGPGSEKEAGNVIIRLKIPSDFGTDAKKYQIDVFGTLNGDALNFQKRKLYYPSCKMDIHWNLGAILYSPIAHKIQKYHVWSDFPDFKEENLLSIKNVSSVRTSRNQQWIAVSNVHGSVNVYSSTEFTLLASSEKNSTSDNICKSFLDFPLSSNSLLCGTENGIILHYEWADASCDMQNIPEWISHCYLQSRKENDFLNAIEEEEKLHLIPRDIELNKENYVLLAGIYQELETLICVIHFKLGQLLNDKDTTDELFSNFVSNDDLLMEMSEENRRKLSVYVNEKIGTQDTSKKVKKENAIKSLSSINLGLITQNYSKQNMTDDIKQIESLNYLFETMKSNEKDVLINRHSFLKSVKFRSKEERISMIKELISEITNIKNEFNKEFDTLYEEKPIAMDCLNEVHLEAKRITRSLPSKAERDFWNATVVERDYRNSLEDIDMTMKEHSSENDAIKEAKNSIECHIKSARRIQEKFDSGVESLLLKKQYCDYKIFKSEIKICTIMFYTLVDEELSKWREDAGKDMKFFEQLQNEIVKLVTELSDVERNIKEKYTELQKIERNLSSKIDNKCSKAIKGREIYCSLKKQPTLQLDECSQNPFYRSSQLICVNDLESISKEMQSRICPNGVETPEWENMRNKQIIALKIGVALRNLQNQATIIIDIKQKCGDADRQLKISQDIVKKSLKILLMLASKFSVNCHSLLSTLMESIDIQPVADRNGDKKHKKNSFSLCYMPGSDHQTWKDIESEVLKIRMVSQHLNETEKVFDHLKKLKSDMILKIGDIKSEYPDVIKDLKSRLEESKQSFSKTRTVAEEIVEGRKKNIFKNLKSRVKSESVTQEKSKECK